MKIATAVVSQADDKGFYSATVVVLDEGLRYTGASRNDTPHEALHSAFSSAAKQVSEQLRKTLSLKLEVSF